MNPDPDLLLHQLNSPTSLKRSLKISFTWLVIRFYVKEITFLTNLGHSPWTAVNNNTILYISCDQKLIFNMLIDKKVFFYNQPNIDFHSSCLWIYDIKSATRDTKSSQSFWVIFTTREAVHENFPVGNSLFRLFWYHINAAQDLGNYVLPHLYHVDQLLSPEWVGKMIQSEDSIRILWEFTTDGLYFFILSNVVI